MKIQDVKDKQGLRIFMAAHRISQEDIARKTRLSPAYVSRMFRDPNPLDARRLEKIKLECIQVLVKRAKAAQEAVEAAGGVD